MYAIRSLCVAIGAAFALSGCGRDAADEPYKVEYLREADVAAPAPVAEISVTGSRVRAAPPPPSPQAESPAPGGALLAYAYELGLKAPKAAIAPLVDAHAKACADAGPAVCQILSSTVTKASDDVVFGHLSLRAAPKWLAGFRAGVAKDAKSAGGEITRDEVTAEDLTSQITDTEVRLAAKRTLRERIKALLERRDGTLKDALEAERALADVQGDIDSMTAELALAKARVAMSALTINYETDLNKSGGAFRPVADAFGDFGRVTLNSFANIVRFVAASWLPAVFGFALIVVLRLIAPLFWRRKRA